MKKANLTAKYCKVKGYHFKKVVYEEHYKIGESLEINEDFLQHAVPFKFGYLRAENKYEFPVSQIRVRNYTHYIQTFRDLGFEVGDMVYIGRNRYFVEDVNMSYYQSTQYQQIKQFFITLK